MSYSTAGHFHSDFFNLYVVTTPGKYEVVFSPSILLFRFRDEEQDEDIASILVTMAMGGFFCVDSVESGTSWHTVVFGISFVTWGNLMTGLENQPVHLSSSEICSVVFLLKSLVSWDMFDLTPE